MIFILIFNKMEQLELYIPKLEDLVLSEDDV